MEDLKIADLERMAAAYEVIELSTAVKPWLLRHLLHDRKLRSVAYFDPDIRFFEAVRDRDRIRRRE